MIVYQITNEVNGKFYIGKTTKTIEERFQSHLRESDYFRQNTYLYKAIRKYGKNNFSIKPLETQVEETKLDERERYWIETLNPQYNLTKGGEGGDTSSSPNYQKAIKEVHRKKPRHEYATYGMLGKSLSAEAKEKISKLNSYPVVCEGVKYPSIKSAEEHYKRIGTPKSVRKRIDNPNHPDWYRLRPKRTC